MDSRKDKFVPAVATLVGTTIGAGFLGIPYVVGKSGFIPGVVYLILVALFIFIVRLYLGETILRTKGNHQLTGYASRYLGRWGKRLMFFSMIFGIYSALVAYLIGEGESLSYMFFNSGQYALYFSLMFWLFLTVLTFIGLKAMKKYEKISMFIILALVVLIFIFFIGKIDYSNLNYINKEHLFLPFGVVLFSFLGFSAMPAVERILLGHEKLMKRVICLSVAIPFAVYFLFTFIVVGAFGETVPEIATLVLGRFFTLLGIMTMFTASFVLSIAIRDMFRFDFKLGRFKGWLLCSFVPLILFLLIYLFNLATFTQILATSGIVAGGITGVLVLLMNKKAKKLGNRKPEFKIKINKWIIWILSIVFVIAVALQLFYG